MTNTNFKFTLKQDTINTIKSKQLNFDLDTVGNAYRVDGFWINGNVDANSNREFAVQMSYKDLNTATAIENCSDTDVIETISLAPRQIATHPDYFKLASMGKGPVWFPLKNCFVTKEHCFLNLHSVGMDAILDMKFEMWGQYVNLDADVISKLQKGTVV